MLFTSFAFFIFFSIYFVIHFLLPPRFRLPLIILGSSIFYAYWNPYYLWIPYLFAFLAYTGSLLIENKEGRKKKKALWLVLISLLLPLLFFKYTNFFFSLFSKERIVHLSLPLGISFVTFTAIAYVVDCYRKKFLPEHKVDRLLGAILFFPHLIAGPIVRPHQILGQLSTVKPFLWSRFQLGLVLFSVGLVKKLVFADTIGVLVDELYAKPSLSSPEALFAIYGFSLQIYCDFSAYTDMALGLSRILGIHLPFNFNQPYTATSIVDFWKRWHITLSTWLRDYLYIPLGGNRDGKAKQIRNLLITMGLGGLWHGANITFVFWGLLHGIYISLHHLIKPSPRSAGGRAVFRILTFHLVTLAWILFRAPNLEKARQVFLDVFQGEQGASFLGFADRHLFALLMLSLSILSHFCDKHSNYRWLNQKAPSIVVWFWILAAWTLSITLQAGSTAQFIYFEF